MTERNDVLNDFFVDGKIKIGLKKGKNKRFFYEPLIKKMSPNLRLIITRNGEEFVMDLYNIERFYKKKLSVKQEIEK